MLNFSTYDQTIIKTIKYPKGIVGNQRTHALSDTVLMSQEKV